MSQEVRIDSPIPFLDLGRLHRLIQDEVENAISTVVANSAFIGGAEVEAFEEEFARMHGSESGAGCGSGTDALTLTLRALGIGPGDEVIVPSKTFVATAEAVVHTGATPILADVDPGSLLISTETVESVMTPRVRAVVPVHLYGHVVPFGAIDRWKSEGLLVVEDAAQAHLATWKDESVGTHGDAACFSFYPGKNLGALGDGGMVLSRHAGLLDEVRRLRDHGRTSKFGHEVVGWCSRLDGIQAAVLRVKLRHLEGWTRSRRALASRYRERLAKRLVPWNDGAVHHLLVARTKDPGSVGDAMRFRGISTGRHYPAALSQVPWIGPGANTPHAELAAATTLSLPMDPLLTLEQVDEISEVFSEVAPSFES